jgi:hypothetical protein
MAKKRRPLRYRGVSDTRIKQLQPVARLVGRLIRALITRDTHHP